MKKSNKNKIFNIIMDLNNGVPKEQVLKQYKINNKYLVSIINQNRYRLKDAVYNQLMLQEQPVEQEEVVAVEGNLAVDTTNTEKIVPITSKTEHPDRKKRKYLSAGQKLEIYKESKSGKSKKEIMEKYDISSSTMSRISNYSKETLEQLKHELDNSTKDLLGETTTIEQQNNNNVIAEEACEEDKIIKLEYTPTAIFGLIKDRHRMPVNRFIYDDVADSDMFRYEHLEKVAELSLKQSLTNTKDGYLEEVVVYTTGLQCALASVFKACLKLKVNLTLMHYNAKTDAYERQEVITIFKSHSNCGNQFRDIVKKHSLGVFCVNTTPEEIVNKEGSFYEIFVGKYRMQIRDSSKLLIFNDSKTAWRYYQNLVQDMPSNTAVYLNNASIEGGKYKKGSCISKYNSDF